MKSGLQRIAEWLIPIITAAVTATGVVYGLGRSSGAAAVQTEDRFRSIESRLDRTERNVEKLSDTVGEFIRAQQAEHREFAVTMERVKTLLEKRP